MRRALPDLIGGAAFIGLAALLLVETLGTGLARDEIARNPVWYPRLLLALMALGAVLLLARGVLRTRGPALTDTDGGARPDWRRLGVAVAVVGAYFAAFEPAGYLIASLVALPAFAVALGYRRPVVVGIVTVLLVTGVWFLFADVFVVRPPGPGLDTLMRAL